MFSFGLLYMWCYYTLITLYVEVIFALPLFFCSSLLKARLTLNTIIKIRSSHIHKCSTERFEVNKYIHIYKETFYFSIYTFKKLF